MEWHERREAFTRSTAANSMVGMILGIGDRHSQNILIDEKTAEVVHIDFGVTFEQGKALRTPETVPFRLTPDVVDGFGVSGVNGVFTNACIETLGVLRENADAILTICEVFVHDPLHKWTVNPLKQRRIENRVEQLDGGEPGNDDDLAEKKKKGSGVTSDGDSTTTLNKIQNLEAGRVLSRLRQKLQGHVDDGEPLSVPAQVKRVIQEATDENNLADLYYGWAAWL
jgi:phosphatidylinositol kinase/protein kinase (PI-3  family)